MSNDILIVEDDENKLRHLCEFMDTFFKNITYTISKSLQAGASSILENDYVLAILDMTLSDFEPRKGEPGGQMNPFGGRDLMHLISIHEKNIPCIVFTQFVSFGPEESLVTIDDLRLDLANDFQFFKGLVYFNSAQELWKSELQKLVETELGRSK